MVRGLLARGALLGCLIFLATGAQAEEPESRDPQAGLPWVFSPESPEVLRARGMAARGRNGNLPATSPFERPPQRVDLFELSQLQIRAAQNRELARKRLMLPPAAVATPLVTNLANPGAEAPLADAASTQMSDSLREGFLLLLLILAVGLLAQRKFVPEFNERIYALVNPWSRETAVDFERSAIVLAEEKSFSEFQARLQAGSPAPGAGGPDDRAGADIFTAARVSIEDIQKLVQAARVNPAETEQRRILREAGLKLRTLQDLMTYPELLPLQQVTCALEPLIKQLIEKAANITSSTLRTLTQGVELLAELCQPDLQPDLLSKAPLRFLVVDDEMFSRYALSVALKRTLNEPEVADNPGTALEMASRQPYDLIFLDVSMPGMDGFELCAKIHETIPNRQTPVVFVSSLRDFDTRAKSIVCGGRDIISKPFLTFELTVKALTLAARERLRGRGVLADAASGEAANVFPQAVLSEAACVVSGNRAETGNAPDKPAAPDQKPLVLKSKLARSFLLQAQVQADGLRELLEKIRPAQNMDGQKAMISELNSRVHSLAVSAEACEQQSLAQITSALEGLVKKLLHNSKNVTASTLQTAAAAVNLIQELCVADSGFDGALSAPIRVLAVDDDPLARRYMTNALQLKFFMPQSAPDGNTALKLAAEQPFDVIFLDIQMPDIDGFTVCWQMRKGTANCDTSVVFVTSSNDPLVKAQADDCGGADFITKPYLCSELALKTITLAYRSRLQSRR